MEGRNVTNWGSSRWGDMPRTKAGITAPGGNSTHLQLPQSSPALLGILLLTSLGSSRAGSGARSTCPAATGRPSPCRVRCQVWVALLAPQRAAPMSTVPQRRLWPVDPVWLCKPWSNLPSWPPMAGGALQWSRASPPALQVPAMPWAELSFLVKVRPKLFLGSCRKQAQSVPFAFQAPTGMYLHFCPWFPWWKSLEDLFTLTSGVKPEGWLHSALAYLRVCTKAIHSVLPDPPDELFKESGLFLLLGLSLHVGVSDRRQAPQQL